MGLVDFCLTQRQQMISSHEVRANDRQIAKLVMEVLRYQDGVIHGRIDI